MSDAAFLDAFIACTLPAAEWTHEAHVRLAWLVLERYSYDDALCHIRTGINRFNDRVLKKENAYHETITVAFTQVIACRRKHLPLHHRFDDFKIAYPDLLDRKLSSLLKHYRHETLFSSQARTGFVAPDLLPLPELLSADEVNAHANGTDHGG